MDGWYGKKQHQVNKDQKASGSEAEVGGVWTPPGAADHTALGKTEDARFYHRLSLAVFEGTEIGVSQPTGRLPVAAPVPG